MLGGRSHTEGKEETAPEQGAWQRFLDQKTAPQRLLLALAAVVTSVAVISGGIYAVAQALRDDDSDVSTPGGGRSTTAVAGQTIVEQQSPAADQLVHDLVEATRGSGTIRLNHLVYEQAGRVIFTDSDLRLVYNCGSGCDIVRLQFPNGLENRPRVVRDGEAAEFLGQYSVRLGRGVDFGDESLDIAFVYLGA